MKAWGFLAVFYKAVSIVHAFGCFQYCSLHPIGLVADAATDDELIKRCVNAAEWKDPESVKVLAHGTMGAEVITYAGTKIVANVIPIRVNAHNSYGGYTGPEWRYCYLSQNDKQVLAIR